MNTPQAQKIILLGGTISATSVFLGSSLADEYGVSVPAIAAPVGGGGGGLYRVAIGTLVAMAGLSVTAEFSPEIAAGLAVSLAGTTFFAFGLPLLLGYFAPAPGSRPKASSSKPLKFPTA